MIKKLLFKRVLIALAMLKWVIGCLAVAGPAPMSLAQTEHKLASPNFSDVGRPRRRRAGGSRGACLVTDKPALTALVPPSSVGATLAESPKLWFYVPYTLTSDRTVEFVLKDDQNKTLYTTTFSSSDTPSGIISLSIPPTVSLATDKNYEWYLLIYCDAQNRDRFVFVNGSIRRLERPELQNQLVALSAEERTNLYTNEEVWYDAVNSLAEQMQVSPQDQNSRQAWTTLLQSVGLEHLASEPFVSCCLPQN